jgi:hypothetical protein
VRRFALRVALALVLIWTTAPAPAPAIAQTPASVPLSFQVVITGPTEVCTDTEVVYEVKVVSVATQPSGATAQSNFAVGGLQPFGLGSVSLSGSVRGGGATGQATAISGTSLPARFPHAGHYTIFVQANSALGYPVQQGFININVTDCEYQVTLLGVWTLNDGFHPWMVGVLDQVVLIRLPDSHYERTTFMVTTAIARTSVGCVVVYDVGDISILFTGSLATAPGPFTLDMKPDAGVTRIAGTGATCPAPIVRLKGQSRPDPFTMDAIHDNFSREGEIRYYPSTIHAYVDAPGQVVLILEKRP